MADVVAIRGAFFDFIDDPWKYVGEEHKAARFYRDGLLVIENGIIKAHGPYEEISTKFPGVQTIPIKDRIILPGFIDGHTHMSQTRVPGLFGQQLFDWLLQDIFPEERKYSDPDYAKEGAKHFFENLLAGGTTTCQSFLTHSPVCTEAFFDEASRRNMLVIGGLTGMDRFAPEDSMDSAENFYKDNKWLIEKYHRKGRNIYAITPLMPIGSTHEMMAACERLKHEHPDCWFNSHLSETAGEVRDTTSYHGCPDILAVFEKYNLVGPKFTGGLSVWTSDDEYRRLSKAGGAVSFCPSSNLYLGAGLFRLGKVTDPTHRVRFSMGTDIGAGTRFSMLNVLDEAYKIGMINNGMLDGIVDPRNMDMAEAERNKLSPYRAFYSLTLGGAQAHYLDDRIGNFDPGKEADFVSLDWTAGQKAMVWQTSRLVDKDGPKNIEQAAKLLFSIMVMGDDRSVDETWIMGEQAYKKSAQEHALSASR